MERSLTKLLLTILIIASVLPFLNGQEKDKSQFNGRIDSITIRKNWRTKDKIIFQEIEFGPGDVVNSGQIKNSISKIWNIGNFARVDYSIDTLGNGMTVLKIIAQDALTIMPNFSFSGNKKEYIMTLGVNDNNFLGRNISLGLAGSFGTNVRYGNINVGIPRQLLYRNMTLSGGFSYGASTNYLYRNENIVSGTAYRYKNASVFIGNPYHTDYKYTFSPNLAMSYFSHRTDPALLGAGIPEWKSYDISYLTLSTNESIGIINHMRHQMDGYLVTAGMGFGIGLNGESKNYFSLGVNTLYSRLLNRCIEVDAGFSTGYTTAEYPSLLSYLGPGHVKGILTGERSGKSIVFANAAILVTYVNSNWFAMEQSFFVNAGNAADTYWDLYATKPLASAGSRLRFMVPMVPWLAINFYYAYRGNGRHWYSLDF